MLGEPKRTWSSTSLLHGFGKTPPDPVLCVLGWWVPMHWSKFPHPSMGAEPGRGKRWTLGLDLVANGKSEPSWGWRRWCRVTDQDMVLFGFSIHITGLIPCSLPPCYIPWPIFSSWQLGLRVQSVTTSICGWPPNHHFPVSWWEKNISIFMHSIEIISHPVHQKYSRASLPLLKLSVSLLLPQYGVSCLPGEK